MELLTIDVVTVAMIMFGIIMLGITFIGCAIAEHSMECSQRMKNIRKKYHSKHMSDWTYRDLTDLNKSVIERDIIDLDALFKKEV